MTIFTIILLITIVVCFIVSFISSFVFVKMGKKFRIAFLLFTLIFFLQGNMLIIPVLQEQYETKEQEQADVSSDVLSDSWNNLPTKEELPEPDEKGTANLSLYVTDDADVSETYYVEATEKDTYKFCYFHEDGEHIVKIEVPADLVQLSHSDTNLPYRVEILMKDNKPILYTLYLPEDSNAVQFDTDGH